MLKLPKMKIGIEVRDPLGNLICSRKEDGHSWVRNAYNYLLAGIARVRGDGTANYSAGYLTTKDIAGSIYSAITHSLNESTGASVYISIGTDNTAFSGNHYNLISACSAASMSPGATSSPLTSYNSGTKTWTTLFSRSFTNISGGDVTVREAGLFMQLVYLFGPGLSTLLMARDVLASPETVALANVLTLYYEIELDLSAVD